MLTCSVLISCKSSKSSATAIASTANVDTTEMAEVMGDTFESLGDTGFGTDSKKIAYAKKTSHQKSFTPEAQSSEDPNCSNKGRPWDVGLGTVMNTTNTEYSNLQFRCLATINSNSPETVRGVLKQAEEISCTLSVITGEPVAFPSSLGDNVVPFSNANLTTTGCFADTSEMPTDVSGTVTYSTLDSSATGFEEKITINITDMDPGTIGNQPFTFTMLFFNENNRMGLKTIEEAEGLDGAGGSAQVTVDLNEGTLFYNYIDDRAKSGEDFRTAVRMKIKATFDANFNITQVSEGSGIYVTSGPNKNESFTMSTIKGNQSTGFKSYAYQYTNNPSESLSEASTNCVDGSCLSETGLVPTAEVAGDFFIGNQATWQTFIQNGQGLCANAELNFSPTPSTGELGICLSN